MTGLDVKYLLQVRQASCKPEHYGPFESEEEAKKYMLEGGWTGEREYVEGWEVLPLYFPK